MSKNDEFCIKNKELCIKNKEVCIKHKELCIKHDEFCRGVKEAVLTAKHGCGFLLWNTSTTLPNGDPYIYHVPADYDVLRQFSDTMKAEGLGHVPPQPPTHPPTHQHSLMCRDISDKLLVCSGLLLQPDQQYVPRRS